MVTETYLKPTYQPTYVTVVTVVTFVTEVTVVKVVTVVTKKLFSPNNFFHQIFFLQKLTFFTNKNAKRTMGLTTCHYYKTFCLVF